MWGPRICGLPRLLHCAVRLRPFLSPLSRFPSYCIICTITFSWSPISHIASTTMALSLCLLVTLVFYQLPSPSFADASGAIALFLDETCEEASIISPSVKLPVDTCLVNAGALGIAVQSLPPCTSGTAALVMYHDTSCANQIQSNLDYHNCYFDGPDGIPAVMFICSAAVGGSLATATSTVTAGSSTIPVAANTPIFSSGDTSAQSTPSSNGATVTSTVVSTSTGSHTSSNSSQTNANGAGSGSGSGLSQSSQIALGVALPVGAILVALFAWWFPCGRR